MAEFKGTKVVRVETINPPKTTKEKLATFDTTGVKSNTNKCLLCGARYPKGSTKTGLCKSCSDKTGNVTKEKLPDTLDNIEEEHCLLCGSVYEKTPVLGNRRDPLCPECRKTYKDTAVLRCFKCGQVICRIAPKVMDSGYIIRPGMVLHSTGCNICTPELTQSGTTTVMEIDEWIKKQRPKKTIIKMGAGTASTSPQSRKTASGSLFRQMS